MYLPSVYFRPSVLETYESKKRFNSRDAYLKQPIGPQPPAQLEQADVRAERVGDQHELPAIKVRMGGYSPI